jgi:hypothetical protein
MAVFSTVDGVEAPLGPLGGVGPSVAAGGGAVALQGEDLDFPLPDHLSVERLPDGDALQERGLDAVHVADGVFKGREASGVHAGHGTQGGPGRKRSRTSKPTTTGPWSLLD